MFESVTKITVFHYAEFVIFNGLADGVHSFDYNTGAI